MQQALHLAASAAISPALPGRFQRGDVIRVLTTIAPRLGLRSGALRALLAMIHMTRASDWTSGQATPICYREQIKVAAVSGVTSRTIRSHETILQRLGLVEKSVGADGSRGRFAQGEIVHGISFRPLIERFPDLLAIAEAVEDETKAAEILRRRCSAARRAFNQALSAVLEADPRQPALLDLLSLKASLPRRYDGLGLGDLQDLFNLVDKAARETLALLSPAVESSDTPEDSDLPHIQATTEPDSESCSGSTALERTARKRADTNTFAAAPKGASDCLEDKARMADRGHKPDFTETFSPRQLYWMASDDMRMYLDAVKRGDGPPTEHDFIQAAISILPAIGVNPSAWDVAAEVMGDFAAALCVIVIDANRHHPQRPIHSPGGALRAFTRLAGAGKLNLHGSLIGLHQRMEARRGLSG